MSMRVSVNCPYCKRPMATSSAFAGQSVACPNCRGEFVLNAPSATPPANPNADLFPPTFRAARGESAAATAVAPAAFTEVTRELAGPSIPAPAPTAVPVLAPAAFPPAPAVASPPAPAPLPPTPSATPPQPANTARFKTSASAAPAIAPSADGKLPELQLADGETAGAAAAGGERPVPLWLAVIAIAGSTVLSMFLLLGDAPAQKSAQTRRAEVREEIATFYGSEAANLRPYQVLLREAQQAHSRGDRATERQKYRQVLALLRSEKRSKFENVTGTPGDDEKLAELLSILLNGE